MQKKEFKTTKLLVEQLTSKKTFLKEKLNVFFMTHSEHTELSINKFNTLSLSIPKRRKNKINSLLQNRKNKEKICK